MIKFYLTSLDKYISVLIVQAYLMLSHFKLSHSRLYVVCQKYIYVYGKIKLLYTYIEKSSYIYAYGKIKLLYSNLYLSTTTTTESTVDADDPLSFTSTMKINKLNVNIGNFNITQFIFYNRKIILIIVFIV